MVAVLTTLPTMPTLATSPIPAEDAGVTASSFLGTVNHALNAVSDTQSRAGQAENAVAEGKPGASQATALVLSDRAELGWSGVVAVRNEVVSAYQTLANMQI